MAVERFFLQFRKGLPVADRFAKICSLAHMNPICNLHIALGTGKCTRKGR